MHSIKISSQSNTASAFDDVYTTKSVFQNILNYMYSFCASCPCFVRSDKKYSTSVMMPDNLDNKLPKKKKRQRYRNKQNRTELNIEEQYCKLIYNIMNRDQQKIDKKNTKFEKKKNKQSLGYSLRERLANTCSMYGSYKKSQHCFTSESDNIELSQATQELNLLYITMKQKKPNVITMQQNKHCKPWGNYCDNYKPNNKQLNKTFVEYNSSSCI